MGIVSHGNILAVFFSASEVEIQEGKTWYDHANQVARSISIQHYFPRGMYTVAGVIAALSPNNRWDKNVRDAEALIKVYSAGEELDAVRVSTYNKNKEKAIRILKGEDPLDVLGGNKVRAFYCCIAGIDDNVCIDGHAFSVWSGERVVTAKTPKISDKLYQSIVDDYCRATDVINQVTGSCYSPAQVQAITWVTWRNLFSGESK